MDHNKLVVFESKFIRRIWHDDEWYFSVVDVCGVLTDSPDAGTYWRKLKQRLNLEGSEVVTNCHGLKLEASDGKKYKTDCANTKIMFRIQNGCSAFPVNSLPQAPQDCKLSFIEVARNEFSDILPVYKFGTMTYSESTISA
jgi:hypothetical protein